MILFQDGESLNIQRDKASSHSACEQLQVSKPLLKNACHNHLLLPSSKLINYNICFSQEKEISSCTSLPIQVDM